MKFEQTVEIFKNNRKIVLCAISSLVVGIVVGGIAGYLCKNFEQRENSKETSVRVDEVEGGEEVAENEENDCVDGIWVDVAGAVVHSGVYCVDFEGTIQDALDAAGGLSDDVCIEWFERSVNRADLIQDENKVYIVRLSDVDCQSTATDDSVQSVSVADASRCPDGKININKATTDVLQELPGVGPSTASKIIESRPYGKIEDLLEVKGIGKSTLDKMREAICI